MRQTLSRCKKCQDTSNFALVVNTSEATLTKDIERTSRRDDGDVTGVEVNPSAASRLLERRGLVVMPINLVEGLQQAM